MRANVISSLLFAASSLAAPPLDKLFSRQNTVGPCDAWAAECQPVRVANACLAAFLRFNVTEDILKCVDDQDLGKAKLDVSEWIS
ncbi:hypothetical protein CC86DRAFT_300624 [Ophiobolus disseminans]|uniref:Extracellular membrane protein CFEM domain-containing protein n=1 Tax=Ophiobolus disseminans TaxID=1469910 RepID=A0A6A6ZMP8_9PLEO|nr:hypothetical protein CC86DRAFT_300624 [Ophiobolus disseminans]